MGVYSVNEAVGFDLNAKFDRAENFLESSLNIVYESERNYNAIMKSIGIHELAVLESTGQEMIYEAADFKGFFAKVYEFLTKLGKKVKDIFSKFFALIDSYTKADKDFIKKYSDKIKGLKTGGMTYKGFIFSLDAVTVDGAKTAIASLTTYPMSYTDTVAANKVSGFVETVNNDEDLSGTIRGSVFKESSLTTTEFNKRLYMEFRDGSSEKVELSNIDTSSELASITKTDKAKRAAETAFSILKTEINAEMKASKVDKAAAKDVDNNILAQYYSATFKCIKEKFAVLTTVNGAYLQALKDQNRQAKAICLAALNYKPKNESAYVESGFLSDVKLI